MGAEVETLTDAERTYLEGFRVPEARKAIRIIDALTGRAEAAERAEKDAVAALDANWIQHQRIVRAEAEAATLRADRESLSTRADYFQTEHRKALDETFKVVRERDAALARVEETERREDDRLQVAGTEIAALCSLVAEGARQLELAISAMGFEGQRENARRWLADPMVQAARAAIAVASSPADRLAEKLRQAPTIAEADFADPEPFV